jgi:hypothetical protein
MAGALLPHESIQNGPKAPVIQSRGAIVARALGAYFSILNVALPVIGRGLRTRVRSEGRTEVVRRLTLGGAEEFLVLFACHGL